MTRMTALAAAAAPTLATGAEAGGSQEPPGVRRHVGTEAGPVSKIAFSSDRDDPNVSTEIYVMNVDGSDHGTGLTNLTNHPSDDSRADWSPDGGTIAFGSNRPETRRSTA